MDDILSFYKYGLNGSVEKIQLAGDDLYLPNTKRATCILL